MDELHAIREGIYEETKDMSAEELFAWLKREAEPTAKRLNLPGATRTTLTPND